MTEHQLVGCAEVGKEHSLRPLDRPTLLFVCSCETDFDTRNELIGWFDPELTECGHRQANSAAEKIINLRAPLHHIYAGSLWRMKQTAQPISEATGVNITYTDALNPWDVGELAGEQRTPELIAKLDAYRADRLTPTPEGESYAEFIERWGTALKGAEDYVRQFPQKTLVLVTDAENVSVASVFVGGTGSSTDLSECQCGSVVKIEFSNVDVRDSITCTSV